MKATLASLKSALRRIPGVATLLRAAEESNEDRAKDMAASIAYFSFFSIFPLLTGVISIASLFVSPTEIRSRLDSALAGEFPGSADFLRSNIAALLELRGPVGIASLLGLFWSASKVFGALNRSLNLELGVPKDHSSYLSTLRYFGMTLLVSFLLFVTVGASMALDLVAQMDLTRFGIDTTVLSMFRGQVASFVSIFLMLSLLYKIVPYEGPSWREVIPGALVAAFLFELGKAPFLLYLDKVSGLEAVYGSLTSVIVLLLWLYFSSRVLLFGAEVVAVRREALGDQP